MNEEIVTLAQLDRFDEAIDVRSPTEFAEDHVPGAINCPVLDDDERARVGTLYQTSPFEAKRLGAALVSKNIARQIEEKFAARGPEWRPLVYCWRGGKRSAAMAHVLREIGWRAATLAGGYRAYRREVIAQLEALPRRLSFVVICGPTGSGKSRLLGALRTAGAQVLDLEAIARHRGSVLGDLPGEPQPGQKLFDSALWDTLRRLDPSRPVFVEAESRKVGNLQLPAALFERMHQSECLRLETPIEERIRLLREEYRHFLADPAALKVRLECLTAHYGRAVIGRWLDRAAAGDWDGLIADLLREHYDPSYRRAIERNYPGFAHAETLSFSPLDDERLRRTARALAKRPLSVTQFTATVA